MIFDTLLLCFGIILSLLHVVNAHGLNSHHKNLVLDSKEKHFQTTLGTDVHSQT